MRSSLAPTHRGQGQFLEYADDSGQESSWQKHRVDVEADIEIARQNIVSDEKIDLR